MSRTRSIKPEFWSSAQVMECSRDARLLFIGIWNFCDDCGRHEWIPKKVKAEVLPGDDISAADVEEIMNEIESHGLIESYVVDGARYFLVTGWRHQRIDKPQRPRFPGPFQEHSANPDDAVPEGNALILDGDPEGPRRKGNGKAKVGRRWGEGEYVPDDWKDWSMEVEGLSRDAANREALRFQDYWLAQTGARAVKLNWEATWRNWVRKAVETGQARRR